MIVYEAPLDEPHHIWVANSHEDFARQFLTSQRYRDLIAKLNEPVAPDGCCSLAILDWLYAYHDDRVFVFDSIWDAMATVFHDYLHWRPFYDEDGSEIIQYLQDWLCQHVDHSRKFTIWQVHTLGRHHMFDNEKDARDEYNLTLAELTSDGGLPEQEVSLTRHVVKWDDEERSFVSFA
jgi:hypothetical protein